MESLEILDRLHRRFPTDAAMPGRALALFRSLMSERMQGFGDEATTFRPLMSLRPLVGKPGCRVS